MTADELQALEAWLRERASQSRSFAQAAADDHGRRLAEEDARKLEAAADVVASVIPK